MTVRTAVAINACRNSADCRPKASRYAHFLLHSENRKPAGPHRLVLCPFLTNPKRLLGCYGCLHTRPRRLRAHQARRLPLADMETEKRAGGSVSVGRQYRRHAGNRVFPDFLFKSGSRSAHEGPDRAQGQIHRKTRKTILGAGSSWSAMASFYVQLRNGAR
jgi:hypothetical protein